MRRGRFGRGRRLPRFGVGAAFMGGVGAEEGFQIGNAFADDCEVSGFVLQANGGEVAGAFDVPAAKFPGGAFSGIGGDA